MKSRKVGDVRARVVFIWAVFLAVSGLVVACSATSGNKHDDVSPIVNAEGSDRLPNETAADWITYADYVVVVHPDAEREVGPSSEEIEIGEGLILRRLTLQVDTVLWARNGSAGAPGHFGWTAYGWAFKGNPNNRVTMADGGTPRIELGHTYIMAIEWVPAQCPPGADAQIPGAWRGLGDSSVLPYDAGTIGNGELGGRRVSPDDIASKSGVPRSLADAMVGRGSAALVSALKGASADVPEKQNFGDSPYPCP